MNATSSQSPWPPPGSGGPNSLTGSGQPLLRPLGPRGSLNGPPPPASGGAPPPPGPPRLPRTFFVREIYKNGFLKRLPYNEKKSSALSKLMKTDRYVQIVILQGSSLVGPNLQPLALAFVVRVLLPLFLGIGLSSVSTMIRCPF